MYVYINTYLEEMHGGVSAWDGLVRGWDRVSSCVGRGYLVGGWRMAPLEKAVGAQAHTWYSIAHRQRSQQEARKKPAVREQLHGARGPRQPRQTASHQVKYEYTSSTSFGVGNCLKYVLCVGSREVEVTSRATSHLEPPEQPPTSRLHRTYTGN